MIRAITDCPLDIKLWPSANFIDCNQRYKTDVILFSPNSQKEHGLDLLSLAPYDQSVVTDLGVRLDAAFELDLQINAMTRFFQLQHFVRACLFFSKVKSVNCDTCSCVAVPYMLGCVRLQCQDCN